MMQWLDIAISKADAMILWELAVRLEDGGDVTAISAAERNALTQLLGALERSGVEDIVEDWDAELAVAVADANEMEADRRAAPPRE